MIADFAKNMESDFVYSGFDKESLKDSFSVPKKAFLEAQAYLLTDRDHGIGYPPKRQRQALGMFLRDRGVPWDIVDTVLEDLGLGNRRGQRK